MATAETIREPCPDRILDDTGGAFAMGVVGGSVVNFIRGLYNSPNGERLAGAAQAIRMNAPRVGGRFAVWGSLFSCFDCSMVYHRQKEDPWNSIFAGAATGGFLQMRQGLRLAAGGALGGAVFLAIVEGGMIMQNCLSTPQNSPTTMEVSNPAGLPPNIATFAGAAAASSATAEGFSQVAHQSNNSNGTSSSSSSSWFGGGKKRDSDLQGGGGGGKTQVLESFDSLPIPSFEYK